MTRSGPRAATGRGSRRGRPRGPCPVRRCAGRPTARRRPSWLLSPAQGHGRRAPLPPRPAAGLASHPAHWSFNGTRSTGGVAMAIDTFVVFVGVYADVEDAEADYKAVKDLHTEAGLLDAYD